MLYIEDADWYLFSSFRLALILEFMLVYVPIVYRIHSVQNSYFLPKKIPDCISLTEYRP